MSQHALAVTGGICCHAGGDAPSERAVGTALQGEDLGATGGGRALRAAPRLLVIDATRIGSTTATGQVKQRLLTGWPADRLLQVHADGAAFGTWPSSPPSRMGVSAQEVRRAVREFRPDVVYVRPLAAPEHFSRVMWEMLDELSTVPVVVHIMDDWLHRLQTEDPQAYPETDRRVRALLQRAAVRMSISTEMSKAFWQRYGLSFEDYANFLDAADVIGIRAAASELPDADSEPVTFRYSGGLAADMGLRSLHDLAEVIEEVGPEHGVRLQIGVLPPWRGAPAQTFADYSYTTVHDAAESLVGYRRWLAGADVCIIAYNFDEASARYTRYSMANKLPDYLAAGKPILAYGPSSFATLRRSAASGGALVIGARTRDGLRKAVLSLARDPELRAMMGRRAQEFGLRQLNNSIRRAFQQRIFEAAGWSDVAAAFAPSASMTLDELAVMQDLVGTDESREAEVVAVDAADSRLPHVIAGRPAAVYVRVAEGPGATRAATALRDAGYAVWLSTWHAGPGDSWQMLSTDLQATGSRAAVLAFRSTPPAQRLRSSVLHHLTPLSSTVLGGRQNKMNTSKQSRPPKAASKKKAAAKVAPSKPAARPAAPRTSRARQLVALHRGVSGLPTVAALSLLVSSLVLAVAGVWFWAGIVAILGALAATISAGVLAARVQNNTARAVRRVSARNARSHARLKRVTNRQRRLAARLDKESSKRDVGHQRLRRAIRRLRDETADRHDFLGAEVARLRKKQSEDAADAVGMVAALEASIETDAADVAGRVAALEASIEKAEAARSDANRDVSRLLEERAEAYEDLVRLTSEVRQAQVQLREEMARIAEGSREQVSAAESRMAERLSSVEQSQDALEKLLPSRSFGQRSAAFNAGHYQPFRRHLEPDDLTQMVTGWTQRLGCRMTTTEVGYLAHRVGVIEGLCRGRLAKTVESSVLMMMVARAALQHATHAGRALRVLEVGTLFGVGAALVYDACRDRGPDIELTVIDPLDGYYGTDVPDMITGVHVTRPVWEANLAAAGVPIEDTTLYQMMSKDAYPQMKDEQFDLIIIDADHTYEGVEVDGAACVDLLAPGGYVLFDDYGNPDWPDVKQYVDEKLLYRPDLQHVGSAFATIVFRAV